MADGIIEIEEDHLSKRLFDAGWKQGTLFQAPMIRTRTALNPSGDNALIAAVEETHYASDDYWIVASQDCDIVAHASVEPTIDIIHCIHEEGVKSGQYRNSYRRFVVDTSMGLVAVAQERVSLPKESFQHLTPIIWPRDEGQRRRFGRWLGGRSSRSAIPDAIVKTITGPILKTLNKEKDRGWGKLVREFDYELRIHIDDQEIARGILIILEQPELTEEQEQALGKLIELIESKTAGTSIQPEDIEVFSLQGLPTDRYLQTMKLPTDDLSYQGDTLLGREPAADS